MARSRNLKPGFFKNEDLATCDVYGRLLFAGLWTIADRAGRLEDRPKRIKAEILPYDDCNVEDLLTQLHYYGFIQRYVVDGSHYIQILTWDKHQNPHVNEAQSIIPAPTEYDTSTVQVPEQHNTNPAESLNTESLIPHPDSQTMESQTTRAENGEAGKVVPFRQAEKIEEDDFEAFYTEFKLYYPDRDGKRVGIDTAAKEEARKVKPKDWPNVILAAKHYAEDGQYPVDPLRFFKSREYPKGYWREWVHWEAQPKHRGPASAPPSQINQYRNGSVAVAEPLTEEQRARIREVDAKLGIVRSVKKPENTS